MVEALGDEVKVTYEVSSDEFDPGTYGSLVELSDQARLGTARTAITLSRSETSILVPGLLGLVARAIGFFVFYWTKRFARYRLRVSPLVLLVAVAFACAAGARPAWMHFGGAWESED